MLTEINGFHLHLPFQNALLRSFLPFIVKNQRWTGNLSLLSKVKNVLFVNQNRPIKLREGNKTCPICQKFIFQGNLLVLILHIEIEHQFAPNCRYYQKNQDDESLIAKIYEFTDDGIQIHLTKRKTNLQIPIKKQSSKKSEKSANNLAPIQFEVKSYVVETKNTFFLQGSLKQRNLALLQRMFLKFKKRVENKQNGQKFYHSWNVYQVIGPQSESSDDQRENPVEKQLEKLRINDFNDVSSWDKLLYLEWNNLFRKQKKSLKIVDSIFPIVKRFVEVCRQKQIPKINLNMHLYTLWSIGRIGQYQIIQILQYYDNFETLDSQNMEKS